MGHCLKYIRALKNFLILILLTHWLLKHVKGVVPKSWNTKFVIYQTITKTGRRLARSLHQLDKLMHCTMPRAELALNECFRSSLMPRIPDTCILRHCTQLVIPDISTQRDNWTCIGSRCVILYFARVQFRREPAINYRMNFSFNVNIDFRM
jgi:hypothetical protein